MSVVAVVPAKEAENGIAAVVVALAGTGAVDRIVVVDDGSADDTSAAARAAGADVVRLDRNQGKGGAVAAGVAAAPDADVYLLVDADVGATAALVPALVEPVAGGEADMAVAVLPAAGRRGGFGVVRELARAGIRRATGREVRAPLSGQRALAGPLLRSLDLAGRFGLEVGLTIDVERAGGRIVEIPLGIEHGHTGRTLAGARHRAGQGADVVRALWPRLTTETQRLAAIAVVAGLVLGAMAWSGGHWEASSAPASARARRVVVFGFSRLSWADVRHGPVPNLRALAARGAVAASSVRTLAGRPNPAEGYASLGAGTRVRADDNGALALQAEAGFEGGTAAEALARRLGTRPSGAVVVVGAPAVARQNRKRHLSSPPGALGAALRAAGKRTAVIGNADVPRRVGRRAPLYRPAAIALADGDGSVDAGVVDRRLTRSDPTAPFGVAADEAEMLAAFDANATADVVLVDPGEMDREAEFEAQTTVAEATRLRARALARTDSLLGAIAHRVGDDTLLLVVSVVPPGREWHLAPMVAAGAGVTPGTLHSPSTRRRGLVTLTDVAPTMLAAVGVPVPDGMIGHALRYHGRPADLAELARMDRDAGFREHIYLPLTVTYIVFQALVYLLAMIAFGRLGGAGRARAALRFVALAIAAWPLATFVHRAIPRVAALGALAVVLLLVIDVAIVALAMRARRFPLRPLQWVVGLTAALLVADVATGAHLQTSSILGYSPHTAARFTGLGNTSFAALAASAIVLGALHVHHGPRRREALATTAAIFVVVVVADGWPSLGSDVGGILTLVPVLGLVLLGLSGRRLSWRLVAAVLAMAVVAVAGAAVVDVARPPEVRTHLGRLVADSGHDGIGPLRTTIQRKLATNFRTYRSPWTWSIIVLSVYLLYLFAWARGWARLLPPGSALRAAATGVLAAGLLGYALNDSGVVVAALVFVYLGPFLTLVALESPTEIGS